MNIVRELRIKKGIQAKQLALEIGVSNATVSDWEHGRKNPTGDRLKRLADYFGVDEGTILGYKSFQQQTANLFIPEDPAVSGKSETDQIRWFLRDQAYTHMGIVRNHCNRDRL